MFDPSALLDTTKTPTTTALFDALRAAEQEAEAQRAAGQNEALGHSLRRMGQLKLVLGEVNGLVDALQEAEMLLGPSPELLLEVGCALCYLGYYNRGKIRLEQAYKRGLTGEKLQGIYELILGTHYYRDQERFEDSEKSLKDALEALDPKQIYPRAVALLALAGNALDQDKLPAAQDYLQKVDTFLKDNRIFWYRPTYWSLQARIAFQQKNYTDAIKLTRKGFGALDDRGDLRMLPRLYRTLAAALEVDAMQDAMQIEDARDARLRSVTSARVRAARIDLAHSLYELGQHYKLYYRRTTQKARGAGYLFEAEQIYREIGITPKIP